MRGRGRGANKAGQGEPGAEEMQGLIDGESLRKNMREIDLVRIVMFMVGGALCGILGLTGMEGFLFYFGVAVTVGLGITARMGFRVRDYTNDGSILTLIIGGLTSQIMSFIMFWTLAYSLAYVY